MHNSWATNSLQPQTNFSRQSETSKQGNGRERVKKMLCKSLQVVDHWTTFTRRNDKSRDAKSERDINVVLRQGVGARSSKVKRLEHMTRRSADWKLVYSSANKLYR